MGTTVLTSLSLSWSIIVPWRFAQVVCEGIKHGNMSSGQMYNMETRQRKIHHRDGSQSMIDNGGENRPDARIVGATKDDPATVKKDGSNSSHTAEDAVVVAAVRGGSLLMLLALIQV